MENKINRNETRNLVLTAFFIALCLILPFITGQIPQIGNMLLPMHIPVLLCGLICGKRYGLIAGIIAPILRSLIFTMPPMYPVAIAMAFELGTYGFISGLIYERVSKDIKGVLIALVSAMIVGRIVWGIAMLILLNIKGGAFPMKVFLGGAIFNAVPGIILQLILIPIVMVAIERSGYGKRN